MCPDIEWKDSKNLFLEEFRFVDQEDALPGRRAILQGIRNIKFH